MHKSIQDLKQELRSRFPDGEGRTTGAPTLETLLAVTLMEKDLLEGSSCQFNEDRVARSVWSPLVLPGIATVQFCSRNEHSFRELVSALIQSEKVIQAIKTVGEKCCIFTLE